jgi:hypothetical protein
MIIYRIYTIDPDGHVANIEVAEWQTIRKSSKRRWPKRTDAPSKFGTTNALSCDFPATPRKRSRDAPWQSID